LRRCFGAFAGLSDIVKGRGILAVNGRFSALLAICPGHSRDTGLSKGLSCLLQRRDGPAPQFVLLPERIAGLTCLSGLDLGFDPVFDPPAGMDNESDQVP
jgi:hypothetical protein